MSSALIPPSWAQLTYWLISEREDSITPLGRDSAPEVYMRRSGSSSAIGTSGIVSSPDCHQGSTSSPAGGRGRTDPAPDSALGSGGGQRFLGGASQGGLGDHAAGPEWRRMNAISSAPSMKLTGTRTTPSRAVAKASSTYCQQLWLSRASRSPLARPRSARACAARLTAASNSA